MKEIKQIGIAQGRQEIVNLAREHYGMTMPHSCNSKPTNIDDVISIIENEEWYNDNKIFKQNIIYHLMYGLTRSGMNSWLLQQERKWMMERQIRYNEDDVGIRKTKLRGFVYSIMNSKFSNSTIKLFRTVMQRKYGEFITVRKPIDTMSSNYIYSERKFLGGSGYVVVCQDHSIFRKELKRDTVESLGIKWIKLCRDHHKMQLPAIHELVDDLYNNDNDNVASESEELNQQTFDNFTYMNNVQNISPVRKQPRLSLPRWNTNLPIENGKIILL